MYIGGFAPSIHLLSVDYMVAKDKNKFAKRQGVLCLMPLLTATYQF
jgi:hypothetical protein